MGCKVLCSMVAVSCAATGVASAVTINPVYSVFYADSITGDNDFIAADGNRYWTIDAGADSYQNEFYERPTVQTYEVRTLSDSSTRFGANEYFENLDIAEGGYGFDETYMYFSIRMYGLDKSTTDGTDTFEGLKYDYGIRLSIDGDGRDGYLLRSDDPLAKNGTTFGTLGNLGYQDTDADVGGLAGSDHSGVAVPGPSGISVTRSDNQNEEADGSESMNGYDMDLISDGMLESSGADVLFTRIDPTDATIVEFAFNYTLAGLSADYAANLMYLDFQALKGDLEDPANYMWNDKFLNTQAGSPYEGMNGLSEFGTQGLGSIYELDTLRGIGGNVVPEPATVALLGMGLLGFAMRRRTKA